MIIFFGISVALLIALPLWAVIGWHKKNDSSQLTTGELPRVSVIIPFRNEGSRILPLLSSLDLLTPGDFEILLIDDHSTDAGPATVSQWASGNPSVSVLQTPEGSEGKKAALSYGIQHASGDVILTTDADCQVQANWIHVTANLFREKEIIFSAGLVAPMNRKSLFGRFTALEMAALTGISAGSLRHGYPTMCNGANLAFRKEAFLSVDGYAGNQHIPSGDDEFLLHKMAERYPKGIRYHTTSDSVVFTENADNFRDFLQQRIRWISKWRHASGNQWLASLLVFAYAGMLAGWISFPFLSPASMIGIASLTLLKFIADLLLLWQVMRVWNRNLIAPDFFLSELAYPGYVLFFALLSFRRQYVWKGRRYEESQA